MNYNSRIDAYGWLSLFLTIGVVALPNFVFGFSWVYFILMLVYDCLLLIAKFSTRYSFSDKELVVQSGFVKFGIGYHRIVQLTKKNSFFAASANTAIKCIEIKFGDNLDDCKTIKISPE